MARSAALALMLAGMAAGHPNSLEGTERRLKYSSSWGHIWTGSAWQVNGQQAQCSSALCDGPRDADVEIRLGGLPPSTAAEAVHLQWWAPRKSPTHYEPLVSPVNCSVHADMRLAYPAYDRADFNGGNVRVSEAGEAVIRVRAPSAYFVWEYIAIPHIHLRTCKGARGFQHTSDAIMLGGEQVWISTNSLDTTIRVLSAHPYAARNASAAPASSAIFAPIAVINSIVHAPSEGSTTLAAGTTTVPFTSTTQSPTTTPSSSDADPRSVAISDARDALDLDALEFSPVYLCLLEQQFFDHFSTGCAQNCPASSDVAHGQCVRKPTADPEVQLEASWQLSVHCTTDPCWQNNKKIASLHNVRLNFAGHLDIPFQEVEAKLGWSTSTSRRLSGAKTAYLTVKVASGRIDTAEGSTLLFSFPQDAATMTTLLGLDVRSVVSGSAPNQQADPSTVNESNDPYGPAYTAVEDLPNGNGPPSTSALSMLPTEAIVGIAVGVVVLAVAAGALLLYRRRQRQSQARSQQAKSVDQKVAEVEVESAPQAIKEKEISI